MVSPILPIGDGDATITAGTWTFEHDVSFFSGGGGSWIDVTYNVTLVDDMSCNGAPDVFGTPATTKINNANDLDPGLFNITVAARTITAADKKKSTSECGI